VARLPSLYLTHGGGPCFWMEFGPPFGPHAFEKLRQYLAGLIAAATAVVDWRDREGSIPIGCIEIVDEAGCFEAGDGSPSLPVSKRRSANEPHSRMRDGSDHPRPNTAQKALDPAPVRWVNERTDEQHCGSLGGKIRRLLGVYRNVWQEAAAQVRGASEIAVRREPDAPKAPRCLILEPPSHA
jgi:hypothetical protein